MKIRVVFGIDCSADAAWAAVHLPRVAASLYAPLLEMSSEGMPDRLASGDKVRVSLRLFGLVPLGSQSIVIEDRYASTASEGFGPNDAHRAWTSSGDARTMVDAGRPLSGPLALLAGWNHEIAISSAPGSGATAPGAVWHDELTIHGVVAPFFWPVLAMMWNWRKHKLKRLARTWG
jgi:hypothetical protein